ncbi:TPA: hypothetical protein HA281_03465 [Candidatus Woesearchaeota archaeon]|nr:hypothetical protein [Candidatus Woesearchaeota archaeon]HII64291.1 hypothetical protein [Candidatus Woesearchaeota archaeon]
MRGALSCVLGADIGGTTATIGIFSPSLRPVMTFSSGTGETNLRLLLAKAAQDAKGRGIAITAACFGVAGPVEGGKVRLTNAPCTLSVREIQKALGISNVRLINDFEAAAYGILTASSRDIIPLTRNKPRKNAPMAVIGAGTGLGKALLHYDAGTGRYAALRSEEGHAPLPVADDEEYALLQFIRKTKKMRMVCWEEALSGRGIATLYDFAVSKRKQALSPPELLVNREIRAASDKASLVAAYRKKDRLCKEAFSLFTRFYARFARTTAASALPYGGLYIRGGIAAKNPDIFSSREFRQEWENAAELKPLLAKIPLFVVKHTGLGVRGAAWHALNRQG